MHLTNGKCKKKFVLAPIKYRRCCPREKADSLYDNMLLGFLSWEYLVWDWTKVFIITNDFSTIFSVTLTCECLCMSWNRPRQGLFTFHNPRPAHYKAIPLQAWTGPEGSRRLSLPDFKTIGTWSWYSCQPYPSGAFTHFCERLSQPQGCSAAGRIRSNKNSNDTIGNRTHDLPACSPVPKPTAPPPTPLPLHYNSVITAQINKCTHFYYGCSNLFLYNQPDALITQIYSVIKLYMFRASSLPIIRSSLLYSRHW
jgi:hypothetical protein